jgi:hypothetical protein
MRAPDVVNATATGFWNCCSTTAAPIAMTAAAMQETVKMRIFVTRSGRRVDDYGPAGAEIKRSVAMVVLMDGPEGAVAAYFPRRLFDSSYMRLSKNSVKYVSSITVNPPPSP